MKLLSTAVAICLALTYLAITAEGTTPQCTQDGLLYEANLDTGTRTSYWQTTTDPDLQGFSVVEVGFFTSPPAPCDWEGLINITLPLPAPGGVQDRALGFEFTHVQSSNDLGFPSFHIGNSIDNDAVTPISSTAEIFNDGSTLKLRTINIYEEEVNFIDLSHDTMIQVGHEFIIADIVGTDRVDLPKYYQNIPLSLDGSTGAAEVYVGLNRIIKNQPPSGKGLCMVKVYAYTC